MLKAPGDQAISLLWSEKDPKVTGRLKQLYGDGDAKGEIYNKAARTWGIQAKGPWEKTIAAGVKINDEMVEAAGRQKPGSEARRHFEEAAENTHEQVKALMRRLGYWRMSLSKEVARRRKEALDFILLRSTETGKELRRIMAEMEGE
jgi:hypothetical protein